MLTVSLKDWIWVDFGVTLGILALNGLVGYFHEKQSQALRGTLQGWRGNGSDITLKC